MRSPADSGRATLRPRLEGLAHALGLGVLLWLLVRALTPAGSVPAARAGGGALPAALARWSTVERPAGAHLDLDGDLPPAALDWLVALARAGTPVSWSGAPAAVAAVNDPLADPTGGVRVMVAAPGGVRVSLDDGDGPLDSVTAASSGAEFVVRSGPRWIRARGGLLSARAATSDSLRLGRILLLGRVGWESTFVLAALEERGWKVDARLLLAPRGNVGDGSPVRLDTSRYSAVVVLDSVAPADLASIGPYLRAGGGAVVAATALRAPALRTIGAAPEGAALPPVEPFDTAAANPRSSLGLLPIGEWAGQVVLERRAGRPAVTARRIERGRLVLVGYQDTWRWRMSGPGDAAEAHRDWWAGLVGGVARVGRAALPPASNVDEAPLARLVDRLGPATAPTAVGAAGFAVPSRLLFGVMAGLLLAGWASRRLRGAP